jgi:TRAP-type transport system periplasmic protein
MKIYRALPLIVLGLAALQAGSSRAETVIKIATAPPRGSVWMRAFDKMTADVSKRTNGSLRLYFYPGMVQGDERDVVRKMGTGQLQGGGFTFTGLGMVNPRVVFFQLPLFFTSVEQVDRVRAALRKELDASFEQHGYKCLGWGDIGFMHFFSVHPIRTLKDLQNQRVWAWGDDPVTKSFIRALGVSPTLAAMPQVFPGLLTGRLEVVYVSPLGLVTLQWQSKVRYAVAQPIFYATAATVVVKKVFDGLTDIERQVLTSSADKYHMEVTRGVRRANDLVMTSLKSSGLQVLPMDSADWAKIQKASVEVQRSMVGRYFSKEFLDRAMKLR